MHTPFLVSLQAEDKDSMHKIIRENKTFSETQKHAHIYTKIIRETLDVSAIDIFLKERVRFE